MLNLKEAYPTLCNVFKLMQQCVPIKCCTYNCQYLDQLHLKE